MDRRYGTHFIPTVGLICVLAVYRLNSTPLVACSTRFSTDHRRLNILWAFKSVVFLFLIIPFSSVMQTPTETEREREMRLRTNLQRAVGSRFLQLYSPAPSTLTPASPREAKLLALGKPCTTSRRLRQVPPSPPRWPPLFRHHAHRKLAPSSLPPSHTHALDHCLHQYAQGQYQVASLPPPLLSFAQPLYPTSLRQL